MIRLFSALGLLFLTISVGLAQSVFHLDSLPSQGVLLDKGWKFHAGDNPDWAKPELDDAKWEAIDPTKDIMAIPQLWKAEVGWFRLRFTIDSTLAKKSIAILLQQTGASEIFLNNELIGQFGTISHNSHQVKAATPVNGSFIGVPISKPGEQVLAVRFAMQKGVPYVIFADRSNTTLALRLMETKTISLYLQGNITVYFDFLRVGLYLIFFVIHLALFWFNPSQKPNLYFSLYAFLNSLISILIGLVYDQVHMATTKMLLLSIVVLIFLVGQLFF